MIIRGQVLHMIVRRNVSRFCARSICCWNLFQPLGLDIDMVYGFVTGKHHYMDVAAAGGKV